MHDQGLRHLVSKQKAGVGSLNVSRSRNAIADHVCEMSTNLRTQL